MTARVVIALVVCIGLYVRTAVAITARRRRIEALADRAFARRAV